MQNIPHLDLLIIVAYVVGVAVLGVSLSGRQRSAGDYFLGNRDIPWVLLLLSIVATETSTVTFLSVPGLAYGGDLTFLQLAFGYIVGRVAVALWLMPGFFRGEPGTLYEVLGARFGPGVRRLTAAIFVLTRTIADGLRLFLTAIVVQELTGWHFALVVLALGAATVTYTFLGGIRAVVWTDALQLVVYMGGALVVGWLLLGRLEGGAGALVESAAAAGKLRLFDFRWDLSVPLTFWSGLIGGAFISGASHGADQLIVQRYLAARSLAQARRALVLSGLAVLVQFAVFLALGLALWAFFQGESFDSPDQVFARFIARELPTGLRGLIVAAALSAAMSTLSSSLSAVASALETDFYRPFAGARYRPARGLAVARAFTVAAGLGQMGVALAFFARGSSRSVVLSVITVAAFTTGLTLGLLLLGRAVPRAGGGAALAALAAGALGVTAVWAFTPVAGPWYALVGALATLAVGAAASLLGRPGAGGSGAATPASPS